MRLASGNRRKMRAPAGSRGQVDLAEGRRALETGRQIGKIDLAESATRRGEIGFRRTRCGKIAAAARTRSR